MGASLSWYAVRGKTPEAVLQDFGLKNVGKEHPESPLCGGLMPNGWYLVIQERHEFTSDEVRRLSISCEVVACFVEEHVMVSRAAQWKNGAQIWSVTHDAQKSGEHLDVQGDPPLNFAAIRGRLTKQQQEESGRRDDPHGSVDFIFNIPVALAREITGYSHEDTPEVTFDNFVKLKTTFIQRMFGR